MQPSNDYDPQDVWISYLDFLPMSQQKFGRKSEEAFESLLKRSAEISRVLSAQVCTYYYVIAHTWAGKR